jgi:4-phytase / acid phosphatase
MFKRMVVLFGLVFALTVPIQAPVLAQTITNANDGTTLKQIIVFGRHSIRASTTDASELQTYSVNDFPVFGVPKGYLTPRGRQAEALLGTYYRDYLLNQGLLTGNDQEDAAHSYFRSNSIERSYETAAAFQGSLIPNASESVHSFPFNTPDPVFDPILTGVAQVDPYRAQNEVQAIFNNGSALASAFSGEYSLIRNVLFNYQPVPQDKTDPTAETVTLTAATATINNNMPLYTGGVINVGGLQSVINAADPFVMQYADGLETAWGRLTLDQLSQQTRIVSLLFDIQMRSPYLNRVQSSNAASHVLRTMEQAVSGHDVRGAFGNAGSKTVVVISSDGYVAGLAGLLQLHWQLLGYQPDFCAPGGALVFELRQSNESKKYLVRAFYTAQTFDQLRNLTPLTLEEPPATMQLLIPGGSQSATNSDVDFRDFKKLLTNAIDRKYVEDSREEVQPGVLTGLSAQ